MRTNLSKTDIPDFLSELDELKKAKRRVSRKRIKDAGPVDRYQVNPSLEIVELTWDVLPLLNGGHRQGDPVPGKREDLAVIWRHPSSEKIITKYAVDEEILALKVCSEGLKVKDIAEETGTDPGLIRSALDAAARKGILIAPGPRIRRSGNFMKGVSHIPEEYLAAGVFTLQWHITHTCDLHCRHCYDRSKRGHLSLEKAVEVLDDLAGFCEDRFVRGHVCFTGGNPFLYPYFQEIYEIAAEKGFSTSILGNPVAVDRLRALTAIRMPGYYQVSLEGMEKHNDLIRGEGNFKKVIEFLSLLKEEGVSSAVMLTLTGDNIDQVIPLTEFLEGRADYFTFNRLSPVGEGARLRLPGEKEYMDFLTDYIEASRSNPVMGYKDNLINAVLYKNKENLFGGCTGYGCGAAFNFLTVLPDGEVHACRKFPSLIGNIRNESITDIYDSGEAEKYRAGTKGCYSCGIKHVCGGCLAVAGGCGKDIFEEKDPYCFI